MCMWMCIVHVIVYRCVWRADRGRAVPWVVQGWYRGDCLRRQRDAEDGAEDKRLQQRILVHLYKIV